VGTLLGVVVISDEVWLVLGVVLRVLWVVIGAGRDALWLVKAAIRRALWLVVAILGALWLTMINWIKAQMPATAISTCQHL
jgi:hypothetical protein